MVTAAQVLVDGQNVDKGQFRSFLDSLQLQYPELPANSEPWGYSNSSPSGANNVLMNTNSAAPGPPAPIVYLQSHYQADASIAVDFAGAYLGSIPLCIYAEAIQTGTNTSNDAATHAIMGYVVNQAAGDNDAIAVSGRARKVNVAGGVGDACGVWGSAYAESTQQGGTLGMETHIYQNVAGMAASDRLNSYWSAGLHVYSDSTGSAALAGVAIDSSGQTEGRYGFWNAIIIDKNCFAGGNIAGTVGINMGSCDAYNNPEYGIKFGSCWQAQIYSQGQPLTIWADNSIYLNANPASEVVGGGSSVFIDIGNGSLSNLVIRAGGRSVFEVLGADGSVHILSGTAIKADL